MRNIAFFIYLIGNIYKCIPKETRFARKSSRTHAKRLPFGTFCCGSDKTTSPFSRIKPVVSISDIKSAI
jgi:hypothetical protein